MKLTSRLVFIMTIATLMVTSTSARAWENKATDEGKGTAFKSKDYEIKEKDEVAILLSFDAGQEVTVTTTGTKKTDVHLFIHDQDKKEAGKDTSPGPECEVKFTPKKAGKFTLLIKNKGPGANTVTLAVKVAK